MTVRERVCFFYGSAFLEETGSGLEGRRSRCDSNGAGRRNPGKPDLPLGREPPEENGQAFGLDFTALTKGAKNYTV